MYDELVKRLREKAGAFDYDGRPDIACDYEQAADAIEELSEQLDGMNEANIALYGALQKWIPVAERLPKESGRYLVIAIEPWFGSTCTEIMRYRAGENLWAYDGRITESKITHWMPLPEPPKEE